MQITNVPALKINKLTQAQYDRERDAGRIDENALYLTLDEEEKDDSVFKVGDILTTTRTDLDNSWLLCNGDTLTFKDYSELAEILPSAIPENMSVKAIWDGDYISNTMVDIIYANGYWVAVGVYQDHENSLYYARVAYTTDLKGTWTMNDLWGGKYWFSPISGITYANGYWVICGQKCVWDSSGNNATSTARIAYTTDLTQPWTIKDLWTSNTSSLSITKISYINNYLVFGGLSYDSSASLKYNYKIAYTDNPANTWMIQTIWSDNNDYNINEVTYGQNCWVVCGGKYPDATKIMYATNLSGPWLEGVSNGLTDFNATGIAYAKGYWVMSGSYWNNSANTEYAKVAYITDIIPNSNSIQAWTTQSLMNARNASWECVTYANGHWLVGGDYRTGTSGNSKYRIAYVKNPPDTWSINEAWTGNPNDTINRIIYADECWVAVGQGTGYEAVIAYKDSFTLPAISTTNAYNYIKAKED